MKRSSCIPFAVFSALFGSPLAAQELTFQAPFACGQEWRASTYAGHESNAIDLVQRAPDQTIIGHYQPTVASAAGEVVFDYTWPPGTGNGWDGERWLILDHGGGRRTHYIHIEDEPGRPRLAVGRRVARGEVIGRTSDSGSPTIHLHYAQLKDANRSAETLASLAAAGNAGSVLGDGTTTRVRFDGEAIDTYLANTDSYTWEDDDAEKIVSLNCAAGRFVQWFDNGRNMMLRYNPANGNMRINEIDPSGGDNPLRHQATWDRTWNTIVPFRSSVNGQTHILRYNFATGDTDFHRVSIGGTGLTYTGSVQKYAGWTEIVPISIEGKPHVIFYDSRYGWFNVDEINITSSGFESRLKTRIQTGYTSLVPYVDGPDRYVLMYKGGTGRMAIQKLTRASDGSISRQTVWTADRRPGWTHLTLLTHRGERHVLGYDSVTGDARIWKILSNGEGLEGGAQLDWAPGWTSITPYRHDSDAHVLLYRASDGLSRKIRLRDDLSGFQHQVSETWTVGYR